MARRVNSKFLLILTILVVGLGMGLFLAKKFLIRESPEKYVAAGSAAMAEKNYRKAVESFRQAVRLDGKNPSLWVAYGDACSELSPEDVDFMTTARRAWLNALTVQPDYKPALDRMMQFWSDAANINSREPEIFKPLHETAVNLFAADPKNSAAEIAIQTSIIRPWLAGIAQDEKRITDTIEKLQNLMDRYPENADLPMFTAEAKLHLAEKRHEQDDTDREKKLVAEANAIVDTSIKRAIEIKVSDTILSAMYFGAAQVTNMQRDILQRQERTNTKGLEQLAQKERDFYARAREKTTAQDPLYVYIHIFSSRASADKPEAEKILKALFEKKPEDQQVRLELAGQLATMPDKREEALKILDMPFANESLKGPKAYLVRELQVQTLATATNLRIEQLARTTDEKERKQLLTKIQDSLNLVATRDGEGPRVLRLRGKLLRVEGKTVESIQTLERARGLAEQRRNAMDVIDDRLERWEVIDMLARAYIETQQIGRAKELLTNLIYRFPTYDSGRMLLASVLIKEGRYEDAKAHVNYLKERKPGDPDVLKMEIQLANPKELNAGNAKTRDVETDRKQLKAIFSKLPEETKEQMLEKVRVALYINQPDDAVRILNKAAAQSPGDYDVARIAVGVYRERGEIENAKTFVDNFLKINPNDSKLKILKKQVADLTPENLAQIMIDQFKENPDKVLSHIGQAQGYRRLNKPRETLEHLNAAEKLKPDDADIKSLKFSYYLWQKQWDQAETLISPLARANQDQAGGLLFRYQLAMERQDYPTALNYAQALVQRMGEFSLSWLSLGRAFHAMGNYDEALKNYLHALERQVGSSRVDLQACKLEYSIVSPK